MDMMRLQTDYSSLPARSLVPLLAGLSSRDEAVERARQSLLAWNDVVDKSSVPAGIYEAWVRALDASVIDVVVPAQARAMARGVPMHRIVEWLTSPGGEFGANPLATPDSLLLTSLSSAGAGLPPRSGADMARGGGGKYHPAFLAPPMSAALDAEQPV